MPFKQVYVTGLIRDERGQKMSKSKGNVIDPLDMIDGIDLETLVDKRTANMMQPQLAEKIAKATRKTYPEGIAPHGADALRFTLVALASTGRDINWDMQRLTGYRNFCNKLWNASRYALMNTEQRDIIWAHNPQGNIINRWINSRLNHYVGAIRSAIDEYRFDRVANLLHEFIWHEYCDWYLELCKPMFADQQQTAESQQLQAETAGTLLRVLDAILHLAHPVIPFITEEIWQSLKPLISAHVPQPLAPSIMLSAFPQTDSSHHDVEAEQLASWLQQLIVWHSQYSF